MRRSVQASGMRRFTPRRRVGCARPAANLTALAALLCTAPTFAAAFAPGDVVVCRIGDGSGALAASGSAVFLDEISPQGDVVQSVAMPTVASGGNHRLVASGTATSECQLERSADERYLVLAGYDADLGTSGLAGSSGSKVARTIARVRFDGSVDTSTALTDFSTGNNPRSVASSDGLFFWAVGGTGGVRYAALGDATSIQLNSDSVNNRYVGIFGGQLFLSSQKQSIRIATVGDGLPTVTGQSTTNLAGFATSGSPEAFFISDLSGTSAGDTLYVADEEAGIEKFSLKNGKWFSNGATGAGSDAYTGIAGEAGDGGVRLYATRKGDELVMLVDQSGFDGTISAAPVLLASAGSNRALRGVALAPIDPVAQTPTRTATTLVPTPTATPVAATSATPTRSELPSATPTADASTPTAVVTATVPSATPVAIGPFTAGNVVVYRVGDGDAALANTGSPVFLDEYTPGGTLVQSVALPTADDGANRPLIASGTATSEGQLTRSADGRFLLLTGYARALGGAGSLASTSADSVPRTVGRVRFDAAIDTTTALSDFSDGNNPRSATSADGDALWVGGGAGGLRYAALGGATSIQLSADLANLRQVQIVDGQLYISTQSGSAFRIASVGEGIPSTAGQGIANLPGIPTSITPNGYFFATLAAGRVLYVADDTTDGGELQKFSLVDGSWVANGTIAAAAARGVTGVVVGSAITLYATTGGNGGAGGGTLYGFTDVTGYNATVSGTAEDLADASANEAFRGIALAPVDAGIPGATATPTATAPPSASAASTATRTPMASPTPPATTTPSTMPTPTGTGISATASPTSVATATAPPTARPPICVGDCAGSGMVTISDLITGVNIALGSAALDVCPAFDCQGTQLVPISCLITAVNAALQGCPS